jgi:carbonic anhydrase
MHAIVDRIRPANMNLGLEDHSLIRDEVDSLAVKANIFHSVDQLRHGSPIIEQFVQEAGVEIIGAEYSLETGIVAFLGNR